MIDIDNLAPGVWSVAAGIPFPAPPRQKRKRKPRPSVISLGTTLKIRRDFRAGLSYRMLAKKHKVTVFSVRRALRGDFYVTVIAKTEGLEPTLTAVCLVGRRSHLQPKNARGNLDEYYSRTRSDEYRHVLTPDEKRAKNAKRMRESRARQRAAERAPGCE